MKDGKDVLFSTDAEKAAFVPQIDIAHQMYNNIWEPKHPAWMTDSYLQNKRNNARILRDKGVTKYRMYEVRGVSHAGGESEGWRGQVLNLDLAKVMDRFIDMIDAWADRGGAPPTSCVGKGFSPTGPPRRTWSGRKRRTSSRNHASANDRRLTATCSR